MAARGYATLDQVAAWYGGSLSTVQQQQALAWMESAERAIDAATRNPFLLGPIVGERHEHDGPLLWLYLRPLATVEGIGGYRRGDTTRYGLVLTQDYELDKPAYSRLYVRSWKAWDYFLIDYTPVQAVPPEVSEATAKLLAVWTADPSAGGAGGNVLSERFADAAATYAAPGTAGTSPLPGGVLALLGPWAAGGVGAFA